MGPRSSACAERGSATCSHGGGGPMRSPRATITTRWRIRRRASRPASAACRVMVTDPAGRRHLARIRSAKGEVGDRVSDHSQYSATRVARRSRFVRNASQYLATATAAVDQTEARRVTGFGPVDRVIRRGEDRVGRSSEVRPWDWTDQGTAVTAFGDLLGLTTADGLNSCSWPAIRVRSDTEIAFPLEHAGHAGGV